MKRSRKGRTGGDQRKINEERWGMSGWYHGGVPAVLWNGTKICFFFPLRPLIPALTYLPVAHLVFPLSLPDTNLCLTPACTNCSCLPPITLPLACIRPLSPPLLSVTLFVSQSLLTPPSPPSWFSYQCKGQLGSYIDDILVSRRCSVIRNVQHLLFAAAVSAL